MIPDKNYNTATKEVRNQIFRGFCPPQLISENEPIEDYQIIFIGSLNWFKTLAPLVSFPRQHDFRGKTIIPFCTLGGGFGQIVSDITKECSESTILPGIAVKGTVTSKEVTN